MFTQANEMVWTNYNIFKNYYYQNLYLAMSHFSKKYFIKEDYVLEDLDQRIGELFENLRRQRDVPINYQVIEHLDNAFYEFMLVLKGKYVKFVPY